MVGISSALLIAASFSALPLSEASSSYLQYKIRAKNLTHQQPFSPILMMAHTEEVQGFELGWPVGDELKLLAEEGDMSALLDRADDKDVVDFVCGIAYSSKALSGGDSHWFTLKVDKELCPNDVLFSMAGMLVNTNDAFVGIDSLTMNNKEAVVVYPPAYDAGTEENNELCSHIPGPACDGTSGNQQAGPGERYVHIHPGFHGIGGQLTADGYDWRNPCRRGFDRPVYVGQVVRPTLPYVTRVPDRSYHVFFA